MRLGKFFAELIDIYCLIVLFTFIKFEFFSGNKFFNCIVFSQFHTGPIHPVFIFIYQRQCFSGILKKHINHRVLYD